MGKLLPIILALVGTGAGVGAGLVLMPSAPAEEQMDEHAEAVHCPPPEADVEHETAPEKEDVPIEGLEFVKLNNQFIIPIVQDDKVSALVVAALSIEVKSGQSELVYSREPKLRDAFLQVFLDHANMGGFQSNFTSGDKMKILRTALFEVAYPILGDVITDVLITEIARQDN